MEKTITQTIHQTNARAILFWGTLFSVASALHFAHNGVYLTEYPNLPAWITASGVYATWCAQFALGVVGYVVYQFKSQRVGLLLLALFALLGFAGLDHYCVAPISAHSIAMNATILFEVTAAAALLVCVSSSFVRMRSNAIRSLI